MKTTFLLSYLTFYLFGTLCLPFGDFSIIADLPGMYKHCKATEDQDLNVAEFFVEHVSGMGQLLEGIEHEDEDKEPGDKPHTPVQFHMQQQQLVCIVQQLKIPVVKPVAQISQIPVTTNPVYISSYIASIFRPPIV